MSDSSLYPCPSCNRHVRAHERACPHCEVTLSNSDVPALAPRTTARLGRAAMLALTTGASIVACGVTRTPAYGAPDIPVDSGPPTTPFPATDLDASVDSPAQDADVEDAGDADPGPDD
jgi:hypothetical protein